MKAPFQLSPGRSFLNGLLPECLASRRNILLGLDASTLCEGKAIQYVAALWLKMLEMELGMIRKFTMAAMVGALMMAVTPAFAQEDPMAGLGDLDPMKMLNPAPAPAAEKPMMKKKMMHHRMMHHRMMGKKMMKKPMMKKPMMKKKMMKKM